MRGRGTVQWPTAILNIAPIVQIAFEDQQCGAAQLRRQWTSELVETQRQAPLDVVARREPAVADELRQARPPTRDRRRGVAAYAREGELPIARRRVRHEARYALDVNSYSNAR